MPNPKRPPYKTTTGEQSQTTKKAENLYAMSLILVIISSLVLFLFGTPYAAWALIISGALAAISMMIKGASERNGSKEIRANRLDRMRMLGGALFLVSGGLALEHQNLWILLFAGGTVFTLYGIFVGDKISK